MKEAGMNSRKNILYALNGTGSGHITRARVILPELEKKYNVDVLVSGKNHIIETDFKVKYNFKGFTFHINSNGKVSYFKSILINNIFRFFYDTLTLNLSKYDLIISDFEPISAWASKIKRKSSLQLSHQACLLSQKTPRPKKIDKIAEFFIKWYSPCDKKIGFHFNKYDSYIFGPLLRDKIIQASPKTENYYVVYLWNYSAMFLVKELSKLSNYKFKIFDSKTLEPKKINNCEIIPTGDDTFFNSILNCKGVICGAGFELPAEVLHLEKKLYVIPIGNQYEQVCNAEALIKMGVDCYSKFYGKHILAWLEKGYKKVKLNEICKVQDVIKKIC
tara:strand:+ start:4259 stop:5254 length:996 start_codon:yes stop_codon:yes gene_type:complete